MAAVASPALVNKPEPFTPLFVVRIAEHAWNSSLLTSALARLSISSQQINKTTSITTAITLQPFFAAAFADFGEHFIIATTLRASSFHSFYWEKYMRSQIFFGVMIVTFLIYCTQPPDVGIRRKWAPRLGSSPSFFRLASVLPPSFSSKFFKGPSERLIPALRTYTFPPQNLPKPWLLLHICPNSNTCGARSLKARPFYLCHHVERLTSKEEEKRGELEGAGTTGS